MQVALSSPIKLSSIPRESFEGTIAMWLNIEYSSVTSSKVNPELSQVGSWKLVVGHKEKGNMGLTLLKVSDQNIPESSALYELYSDTLLRVFFEGAPDQGISVLLEEVWAWSRLLSECEMAALYNVDDYSIKPSSFAKGTQGSQILSTKADLIERLTITVDIQLESSSERQVIASNDANGIPDGFAFAFGVENGFLFVELRRACPFEPCRGLVSVVSAKAFILPKKRYSVGLDVTKHSARFYVQGRLVDVVDFDSIVGILFSHQLTIGEEQGQRDSLFQGTIDNLCIWPGGPTSDLDAVMKDVSTCCSPAQLTATAMYRFTFDESIGGMYVLNRGTLRNQLPLLAINGMRKKSAPTASLSSSGKYQKEKTFRNSLAGIQKMTLVIL